MGGVVPGYLFLVTRCLIEAIRPGAGSPRETFRDASHTITRFVPKSASKTSCTPTGRSFVPDGAGGDGKVYTPRNWPVTMGCCFALSAMPMPQSSLLAPKLVEAT